MLLSREDNNMSNKQAKESIRQRKERISETNNGMTLRTRTVPSKKKYNRQKVKKNIETDN